jgi:hypothetical protein
VVSFRFLNEGLKKGFLLKQGLKGMQGLESGSMMGPSIVLVWGDVDLEGFGNDYIAPAG